MNRAIYAVSVLLAGAFSGCNAPQQSSPTAEPTSKIQFDLTTIDSDGLRGPADGKVAVAYEFVIPDTPQHREEVRAIDPSVQFMPGSRGRVGAGEGEGLCVGSTHQAEWREVLTKLAALPYVERIEQCWFE
ncbi:hypothetical protein [Aeoliella sp. SH292]|uniref:hypothetical protein n=1 Tax=Aeoliella sp. SH292 TaxID=3454464 RepID=UPI003F97B31B